MSEGYIPGKFEVSGQPRLLGGYLEASIFEQAPENVTNIIRIDQDWGVVFKWGLEGSLKRMICGEWCLHLDLESIGKGEEFSLPDPRNEVHIDFKGCERCEFEYVFRVPKGTVDARHCSVPYKLVATVTYLDECDVPGPMAGYVEGPIIQFYDPGPTK
jgi:hypothetical protein